MEKSLPRISEAEWAVMKILWVTAPVSAQQVIDQLGVSYQGHPKTIKTLLSRLVKKKALKYEKKGRAYLYSPLVTEVECVRAESRSFLHRVFAGGASSDVDSFGGRSATDCRTGRRVESHAQRQKEG